ncbi:putative lipoprotein [Cystobacter fuscus]|uniref:Putative lipoprotein n=1 Tax=Cystobacter fuscus TaxID=43 RepID=A0A250IVK7_9BACT|nr:MopE-related protein [Cystobacter fuscus]ATB35759.1 putative lipoprotein [Cystobacter fuscus]
MKSISSLVCALGCGLVMAVAASACWVPELPDGTVFSCDSNEDCTLAGEKCVPRAGLSGYCCAPSANPTEVCNGVDDDCNGQKDDLAATTCYGGPAGTAGKGICKAGTPKCGANNEQLCEGEVLPTAELCNRIDDNCDGVTDEGFDLQQDVKNCGACGTACAASQTCVAGKCMGRVQQVCTDGSDDDEDGLVGCADPDCTQKSCGTNRVCYGGKCGDIELVCSDNVDNDQDGNTDCKDSDCDQKACGTGCVCKALAKAETACLDKLDNDGDGKIDCADSDCPTDCGTGCVCNSNVATETLCGDGVDNDKDGKTDCADSDCANLSCGTGCTCKSNVAAETTCNDGVDNDKDNKTDCADTADCPTGTTCGSGKTCRSNGTCS